MRILAFLLLFCLAMPVYARPSLRSLREGVQEFEKQVKAMHGKQKYCDALTGMCVIYPSSWLPGEEDMKTATDGTRYQEILFIPHDRDRVVGARPNRILELYLLIWPHQVADDQLDDFVRTESANRYKEFWAYDPVLFYVDNNEGLLYRMDSMTGDRKEFWFAADGYVYTLGYRSLARYVEKDEFFFDDFLENATYKPPEVTVIDDRMPEVIVDDGIFSDVSAVHPYRSAIEWGKKSAVLSGYPDGTFLPDRTVNRAEFLKIVLEAAGVDVADVSNAGFPDVDDTAWYAPYVAYAKALGIVQGYADGTFRPEQTVNSAEALKMAYKAFGFESQSESDVWYKPYLDHAKQWEILFSNDLDVGSDMTRKDTVWIVWRLRTGE